MKNIAISVIIPVYNVEKYLRECMDSVLGQKLENIEVICVNDGSSDNSPYILEEYAKKDSRVKVIHKENGGYGHTMNVGNAIATGEYLAIAEPDDYIDETMYEDLYKVAKENDLDFVKSNYYCFWGNDTDERNFEIIPLINDSSLYNRVLNRKEIKLLYRGHIGHWSGLYKREFIQRNNIKYNETAGASYQDTGYFFQTMMFAERGYLVENAYYRYRQDNPNSSIVNKAKVFCICDEHEYIYNIIKKDEKLFDKYMDSFELFKYQNYMFCFKRIAEQYKVPFLKRVKSEYEKTILNNEMKWDAFLGYEMNDIKAIIENPEKYVIDYLKKVSDLHKKIKGYKNIIIYGAGGKSKEIIDILRGHLDEFENLCFAVTERNYINKTKFGFEIKCIYDLVGLKDESVVIIAVTELYKNQIEKVLSELQFKNVVSLD